MYSAHSILPFNHSNIMRHCPLNHISKSRSFIPKVYCSVIDTTVVNYRHSQFSYICTCSCPQNSGWWNCGRQRFCFNAVICHFESIWVTFTSLMNPIVIKFCGDLWFSSIFDRKVWSANITVDYMAWKALQNCNQIIQNFMSTLVDSVRFMMHIFVGVN